MHYAQSGIVEQSWSSADSLCRILIQLLQCSLYLQGGGEGLLVSIVMYPYSRMAMLLQEQSGAMLCQHRMSDTRVRTPFYSGSFCWYSLFPSKYPCWVVHPAHKWSLAPQQLQSPAGLGGWTFPLTWLSYKCLRRFPSSTILLLLFTTTVTNSWHLYPACALIAAARCLFAHGAFW